MCKRSKYSTNFRSLLEFVELVNYLIDRRYSSIEHLSPHLTSLQISDIKSLREECEAKRKRQFDLQLSRGPFLG